MILTTVTVVSEATSREGESGNVFNIKMIIYTLNACSKFPVNVTESTQPAMLLEIPSKVLCNNQMDLFFKISNNL